MKYAVWLLAGLLTLLPACKNLLIIGREMEKTIPSFAEVRPPALKYVLIDTADEMYEALVKRPELYSSVYEQTPAMQKHLVWLRKTYSALPQQMKSKLEYIYSSVNSWHLMNLTTRLADDAGIDEITALFDSAGFLTGDPYLNGELKAAMHSFYEYFYVHHLKDYMETREEEFFRRAGEMQKRLAGSGNFLTFMENTAGISFRKKYRCLFYYTYRSIGASGFKYGDLYISTIQDSVRDFQMLLYTPFHEYGHELFQTFTRSREFTSLTEKLRQDEEFYSYWKRHHQDSYSWSGFCEENLVEGFAKFLRHRYYGLPQGNPIYVHDYAFYRYLLESGFDARQKSLKEASFAFYRYILNELQQPSGTS